MTIIPHSSPSLGAQEAAAAAAVVHSNMVKGGALRDRLESRCAQRFAAVKAIMATSGSQALHLALRSRFGRDSGARVILPSYICRSVYDATLLAGCEPVLLDIDPTTFSLAADAALTASGDAIVVAHMFGIRAPIEQFTGGAAFVVEDCAQRLAPSGDRDAHGDVRILSFEATKLLTCGEGGALLVDDEDLAIRALALRDGPYETAQSALWLPLTDIQAAIAEVQLERLDSFLERRRTIAETYVAALDPTSVHPAMRHGDTWHFRFVLDVEHPARLIASLEQRGVTARQPVAPRALHQQYGVPGEFPNTERAMDRAVSIPVYPSLSDEDVERVVEAVQTALEEQ